MQINVTEQELNIIGMGLGKLPFETAAPVIQKLQTQINYEVAQQVKDGVNEKAPQETAQAKITKGRGKLKAQAEA